MTRVDAAAAGRTCPAHAGIAIIGSLARLSLVEDRRPDRRDLLGGAVCLAGAVIIIGAPR